MILKGVFLFSWKMILTESKASAKAKDVAKSLLLGCRRLLVPDIYMSKVFSIVGMISKGGMPFGASGHAFIFRIF